MDVALDTRHKYIDNGSEYAYHDLHDTVPDLVFAATPSDITASSNGGTLCMRRCISSSYTSLPPLQSFRDTKDGFGYKHQRKCAEFVVVNGIQGHTRAHNLVKSGDTIPRTRPTISIAGRKSRYGCSEAGTQGEKIMEAMRNLPWFIEDRIYMYAGASTAYMHGRMVRPLTQDEARRVAYDAISSDFVEAAQVVVGPWCTVERMFASSTEMQQVVEKKCGVKMSNVCTQTDVRMIMRYIDAETSIVKTAIANAALERVQAWTMMTSTEGFAYTFRRVCVLACAAALGRVDVLQKVIVSGGGSRLDEAFEAACVHGQIEVVKYLVEECGYDASGSIGAIVRGGSAKVYEYVTGRVAGVLEDADVHECRNVAVYKKLVEDRRTWGFKKMYRRVKQFAARYGDVELLEQTEKYQLGEAMEVVVLRIAAEHGQVGVCEYVMSKYGQIDVHGAVVVACEHGEYEVVRVMMERGGGYIKRIVSRYDWSYSCRP